MTQALRKDGHFVVTGAGRGLGLEFCRQLLADGATVVAGYRDPGRAAALNELAVAHRDRLHVHALDVRDVASISAFSTTAAAQWPQLDGLVHCAGILPRGERFGALAPAPMLDAYATNAVGPLLLTQALAPLLARAPRAVVLNLGSELGSNARRTRFGQPAYAMSKAALNMATRQLAQALPANVVCLSACPGWVRTDLGGAQAPLTADESVASLLELMHRAGPDLSGAFLDRKGVPLPW